MQMFKSDNNFLIYEEDELWKQFEGTPAFVEFIEQYGPFDQKLAKRMFGLGVAHQVVKTMPHDDGEME